MNWKRTLQEVVLTSRQKAVVYTHSPQFSTELCQEDGESYDTSQLVYLRLSTPPFYLLLFNTVHGLTPLLVVDFISALNTRPSEVRVGTGHSL